MHARSCSVLALLLLSLPLLAEDAPALKPGEKAGEVRMIGGIKFGWCPPGKFTMGSPESENARSDSENQVTGTLSNGFYLGQHEVSQIL